MAWKLQSDFGIAVEINSLSEDEANVWVPSIGGKQLPPRFAINYPVIKDRHCNTYAAPGLEEGKPALLLKIHTEDELKEAIDYIQMIQ